MFMNTYHNPSIYLVDTDIFYSNIVEHYIVLNNINHVQTFENLSECMDDTTEAPSFLFVNEELILKLKTTPLKKLKKEIPSNRNCGFIRINESKKCCRCLKRWSH